MDPVRSLVYPFEAGILDVPVDGRAAIIRAVASPALSLFQDIGVLCEQSDKAAYDRLTDLGFECVQRLDGEIDLILLLLTKDKTENFANIARAWSLLKPNGTLVCSGANDIGAKSIERQAGKALPGLESLSKFHSRVFWAEKTDAQTPAPFAAWQAAAKLQTITGTDYVAQAGSFGWRQVDTGSKLLAENLSGKLTGAGADLGAGWGYLSAEILKFCPKVSAIDLFEAEALALDAAQQNLRNPAACEVSYHWHDVTRGLDGRKYDWIVTNPPFHAGKRADVGLGQTFIETAAKALNPGGRIFLVANRHLPYEAIVDAQFKRFDMIADDAGFKVIEAVR